MHHMQLIPTSIPQTATDEAWTHGTSMGSKKSTDIFDQNEYNWFICCLMAYQSSWVI